MVDLLVNIQFPRVSKGICNMSKSFEQEIDIERYARRFLTSPKCSTCNDKRQSSLWKLASMVRLIWL